MSPLFLRKKKFREAAVARRRDAAAEDDIGAKLLDHFDRIRDRPRREVVSGYWPIGDEANVMPLLRALGERGLTMALPVVAARDHPLTFRRWRPDDKMDTGPFGIREPRQEAPALLPDLVLAPLLAFDRSGGRLGYGGGYYDRTITNLRIEKPVSVIGIAYAAQEYPTVPTTDTDVRLDWILTENGAIDVGHDL